MVDLASIIKMGMPAAALDPTEAQIVKWMTVISATFTPFVWREHVNVGLDSKVMAFNAKKSKNVIIVVSMPHV